MTSAVQRIHRLVEEVLAGKGLDARRCYTSVGPLPPAGERVVVECSDAAVSRDVEEKVRAEGLGGGVEVVTLPRPGGRGGGRLVAISSVADVRREPAHASELLTQVIYGDAVVPLKDEGDWHLVRLDDGYVGWVRSWHLLFLTEEKIISYNDRARHRVAVNHAEVLSAPDQGALPVTDLVVGTRLSVEPCPRRGWRSVTLPDGKAGFVASRAVEPIPKGRKPSRARLEAHLAATGLRFLGIPYLWGGTTPKGFDCSGLIQRVFRLHGVLLPRDSDLQAGYGDERPVGDIAALRAGDLLFFGVQADRITHVAMRLPDGLILHAYGQVRTASLDQRHPLYDANLNRIWQLSRDPLAPALERGDLG
jgi:hypothetical protein